MEQQAASDFTEWLSRAEANMAGKAKPVGSLGVLEQLACRLSALQGSLHPQVGRTCLLVFAADHGVASARPEISAFPRVLSAPVFRAVVRGQAASAVLCGANGCTTLLAVDVGLAADVTDAQPPVPPAAAVPNDVRIGVMHRKVRPDGSRNMLEEPAMSEEELAAAMQAGADAVLAAVRSNTLPADGPATDGSSQLANGCTAGDLPPDWRSTVICLGEVGLGNTTAAAALLAALTGAAPEDVCGRGTGVDDAGLAAKRAVVAGAVTVHAEVLLKEGPLGALRAVGGLELAGMAGAVLRAAELGLPVVVDGFICGAAALAALAHRPDPVRRCLLLSHRSSERGAGLLLAALQGIAPLLPHMMRAGGITSATTTATATSTPTAVTAEAGVHCGGGGGGGEDRQNTAMDKHCRQHMTTCCGEVSGARGQQMSTAPAPVSSTAEGARTLTGAIVCPTPAVLDMGLRLGEGTGAVLMLPLLRSAAAVMARMASLQEVLAAGVGSAE